MPDIRSFLSPKRGCGSPVSQEAKKVKLGGGFSHLEYALEVSWREKLADEFTKPYFTSLQKKLTAEEEKNKIVYPPKEHIFRAFELTPWSKLKVVILGQDPYHDTGQAEGLCFSVARGIAKPSSLRNIFKEISSDIGPSFKVPQHGSLVKWAEQGVLLLNTTLTVEAHKANSHKDFGWQTFTDRVIQVISKEHEGVVFLLWGNHARRKAALIDAAKHHILESVHPSGLSAHRGFFGCSHFTKTNQILEADRKEPIDWTIPN